MASLEEPPHHVGAHPAQAYHSELHRRLPFKNRFRRIS
jgi:hypothetical protein